MTPALHMPSAPKHALRASCACFCGVRRSGRTPVWASLHLLLFSHCKHEPLRDPTMMGHPEMALGSYEGLSAGPHIGAALPGEA